MSFPNAGDGENYRRQSTERTYRLNTTALEFPQVVFSISHGQPLVEGRVHRTLPGSSEMYGMEIGGFPRPFSVAAFRTLLLSLLPRNHLWQWIERTGEFATAQEYFCFAHDLSVFIASIGRLIVKKGATVTVTDFFGNQLLRVIVDFDDEYVFVCNKHEWKAAKAANRQPES